MLSLARNSRGFGLLEILIALAILSVCFLGIAGLENAAFKRTYDAYLRSIATTQINNMVERVRAGTAQECSNWIAENKALLPHGNGKCNNNKISVCWQYTRGEECVESKL